MSAPLPPPTLNRVSWLRTDTAYLHEAYARDDARFLIFRGLDPLVEASKASQSEIVRLTRSEIGQYLPNDPFRPIETADVQTIDDAPLVVFLGVEEGAEVGSASLPAREASKPHAPPVFAVDFSTRKREVETILKAGAASAHRDFLSLRTQVDRLSMHDAGLAACARSLLDWNRRTRFCAGCGRPVAPINGGWKRTCQSSDADACPSANRVQNYTFPRTDGVIIVAILHPTEDKILLGRQRVWPAKFVSCLAGFIEPGETLEEAAIREIYEEAGVKVRHVRYLRSQPWPFPNSLMLGLVCEAEPASEIRTDLDNELESAAWYDRQTILEALGKAEGFSAKERQHIDANYGNKMAEKLDQECAPRAGIRLPPITAIAHHLIKLWAIGEVSRTSTSTSHSKM